MNIARLLKTVVRVSYPPCVQSSDNPKPNFLAKAQYKFYLCYVKLFTYSKVVCHTTSEPKEHKSKGRTLFVVMFSTPKMTF